METTIQTFQLIVSVVTVIGSIFGAYVGVRIAITKLEGKFEKTEVKVEGINTRLTRVENKVFE